MIDSISSRRPSGTRWHSLEADFQRFENGLLLGENQTFLTELFGERTRFFATFLTELFGE
jgi:hypothetical protein